MTVQAHDELRPIDLKDPDLYQPGVPHETFAWLRANNPVYWNPETDGAGFWALTRHADVMAASSDPATFSSARANGGHRIFNENEFSDSEIEASMISMDPPTHVDYRRMVMGGFTPPRLRDMEAGVRRRAVNLIEAMIEKARAAGEPIDFVSSFSAPYAIQTLAELFGVPESDGDKLFEWSNAVVGEDDPECRSSPEYMEQSIGQMAMYSMGLWQARAEQPGGDLISMLVKAAQDGTEMSIPRYLSTFILLVVAGNETTRNSITGGLIALDENPEQREKAMGEKALLPHLAQEIVRYISPVLHMRRTATRDVEIGGQPIRKGDKVVMWYASANRDERAFDDPHRFDIARTTRPGAAKHLGFGFGEHVCLGQRLAELQLRVAYEELFARLPDLRPAGPPRRLRSNFINGIKSLPVTFATR
ncbi:MAG: cytochrome P450 [Caulobacteraceae bacterium]|nr:cytochrome P450 [Caulobacteraceae bacterium]